MQGRMRSLGRSGWTFHLRDLGYLVLRGPRAYGRRRTPRVRRYWAGVVRLGQPLDYLRYRLGRRLLPKPSLAPIPEDAGVVRVEGLPEPLVSAAVDEAERILRSLDLDAMAVANAGQHMYSIDFADRIGMDSAILRLALEPDVVRVLSDYMGVVPVVSYIGLQYSPNQVTIPGTSQFFHFDGHDVRTVKMFVNVSDMAEDNGPLTVMMAHASERLARAISYRKTEATKRIPDDVALSYVDRDRETRVLTGDRGSVHLVDTDRCFHYGSRAASRPRVLLEVQYHSPFAFILPRRFRRDLVFAPLAAAPSVSELDRLVLGGPPR